MGTARDIGRLLLRYRNQLVVILTPLILLPLPLTVEGSEAKCGFALLLLATYWCTEAIPIEATALIPVFLFPMMGILSVNDTVSEYMKDTIMMFLGGLTVAIALEKNNLHKRIALSILCMIGTQPKWLMLGFMLPTWFMSMWISNTATAAMMLPMLEAVLDQIKPQHKEAEDEDPEVHTVLVDSGVDENGLLPSAKGEDVEMTDSNGHSGEHSKDHTERPHVLTTMVSQAGQPLLNSEFKKESAHFTKLTKGFLLSIAFSANVGGLATLTGTPPNLILKGFVDEIWQDHGLPSPVDFPSWMIYGLPISLILIVIVWFWMQIAYLGFRTTCLCCKKQKGDPRAKQLIQDEYKKLGPMNFAEIAVSLLFILLVCLWFFRDPDFLTGWATHLKDGFIGDSVPAMLVALILFVIPASFHVRTNENGEIDTTPPPTLMDWHIMHKRQPWGTHLLIGGGFALAAACTKSGLANWIGDQLQVFKALPGWAMVTVMSFVVSLVTNVTSNSAMSTLLMPIMAIMAEGLGRNPLYLMFPVCVATSLAFMLPVGTPPNAIVFSSGKLRVIDMAKSGIFLNIVCTLAVTLATETWGYAYFDFGTIPWDTNTTVTYNGNV